MLKIDNIKFIDFSISMNDSLSFGELARPGICVLLCLKTNRAFFWGAENVLHEIGSFFENLVEGSFKNKQILEDFLFYGKQNFRFFVLDCDLELENLIKREKALNYYKNMYSGQFY